MKLGELIDALDAARDKIGDDAEVSAYITGESSAGIPDLTAAIVRVSSWPPDPDDGLPGGVLLLCTD